MKKIFSVLLMLAVMLTSTVVFAAFKEDITEGAKLDRYQRLAVALPMHFKSEATEPTLTEFTNIIFDASSRNSNRFIISYNDIANNIMRDTGVDIVSLQDEKSRQIYKENIAKYADAYVVVTTANNIQKTQFFFEVFDAKTGELVYNLSIQGGGLKKTSKDYGSACGDFYRKFDLAAKIQIKEAEKQAKLEKKKAKKNKNNED